MPTNLTKKVIKIGDSKYRVGQKIANGTYSTIYEGSSDDLHSSVAIKHLAFHMSQKLVYEVHVKEEAILEEVRSHKNIIKLIDK